MNEKDLKEIRAIFETQLANGEMVIKLNAPMFQDLLEYAENHNAKVTYRGKLPVGHERD